jgi:hypothetical protein
MFVHLLLIYTRFFCFFVWEGLLWVFLILCSGVGVGLFFVLGCFFVCVRMRHVVFSSCGMVGYVGLGWDEDEGYIAFCF